MEIRDNAFEPEPIRIYNYEKSADTLTKHFDSKIKKHRRKCTNFTPKKKRRK